MKALALFILTGLVWISGCIRINKHSGELPPQSVYVPSLNRDFSLSSNLTYAAMMILNETSAHFLRVAQDLTLKPDVFSSYKMLDSGRVYEFQMNTEYRSLKGEEITARDIVHTIRWYLQKKPSLSNAFAGIEGVEQCNQTNCDSLKVIALSQTQIRIQLRSPDRTFPEKIASPWILVLKAERPEVERIDQCIVPYQTGRMKIVSCDAQKIELDYQGRKIIVSTDRAHLSSPVSELLTSNPSSSASPTLTTLGLFANPDSKSLSKKDRIAFLKAVHKKAPEMANTLSLNPSAYLAPRWFGIQSDATVVKKEKGSGKPYKCPSAPIQILTDTSIPGASILKDLLNQLTGCPIELKITNAANYFDDFKKADFGFCWFTPDFLALSNIYGEFQCFDNGPCYFNWNDRTLQTMLKTLNDADAKSEPTKEIAAGIESHLLNSGYVAPIAEMNWWISKSDRKVPVHPAGLFQVRLGDFL